MCNQNVSETIARRQTPARGTHELASPHMGRTTSLELAAPGYFNTIGRILLDSKITLSFEEIKSLEYIASSVSRKHVEKPIRRVDRAMVREDFKLEDPG